MYKHLLHLKIVSNLPTGFEICTNKIKVTMILSFIIPKKVILLLKLSMKLISLTIRYCPGLLLLIRRITGLLILKNWGESPVGL